MFDGNKSKRTKQDNSNNGPHGQRDFWKIDLKQVRERLMHLPGAKVLKAKWTSVQRL